MFGSARQLFLYPCNVEVDAAVRRAASGFYFPIDAACDVIARQQLGRTICGLVALRVSPTFLRVLGSLVLVVVGNVVEHEALTLVVLQDPAFAANTFGHEDAADARRPNHARRMELDELHVDQFCSSVIRKRVAVAGSFPAV